MSFWEKNAVPLAGLVCSTILALAILFVPAKKSETLMVAGMSLASNLAGVAGGLAQSFKGGKKDEN